MIHTSLSSLKDTFQFVKELFACAKVYFGNVFNNLSAIICVLIVQLNIRIITV